MTKKKGCLSLFVISLVFLAGWLALWLVFTLTNGAPYDIMTRLTEIANAITFQSVNGVLNSALVITVLGVALVLIVAGIIVKCVQHEGKKALFLIAIPFLAFPAADYCASNQLYNGLLKGDRGAVFEPFKTGNWWFVAVALFCALVALILLVVWYILLLKGPKAVTETVAETAPEAVAVEEPVVEEPAPVEDTPVVFESLTVEPTPEIEEEPLPEEEFVPPVEEPEAPVEEPAPEKESLADMLKEVIRDIVRDEISKNIEVNKNNTTPATVTGATFGGPLVVQYFNGGIQNPTPAPAPAPAPVTPKVEETPTPVAETTPVTPKVEETPAPVVGPAPGVVTPVQDPAATDKKPIVRIPFQERIVDADKELQDAYNELKNEILAYGIKSRVSSSGDTFRLHRKTYCKVAVAGKSLKFHFALNPADYVDSKMPIGDASDKDLYAEIPLIFKVKSGLSIRRCKGLIADVAAKDGLVKEDEPGKTNWVKEIKAELKAGKAKKAEEGDKDNK